MNEMEKFNTVLADYNALVMKWRTEIPPRTFCAFISTCSAITALQAAPDFDEAAKVVLDGLSAAKEILKLANELEKK